MNTDSTTHSSSTPTPTPRTRTADALDPETGQCHAHKMSALEYDYDVAMRDLAATKAKLEGAEAQSKERLALWETTERENARLTNLLAIYRPVKCSGDGSLTAT